MDRWLNVHAGPTIHSVESGRASSAGRTGLGSRRRTRQRAPAKAWLATVAKPCLVGAQREQQVRDPVAGRQVRVGRPHAPAVHAARRARAARPPPPRARRRARRARAPGPVRACSSRASWPTRSPSSPSAVASAVSPARALRLDHLRAAVGVELRDRPRVRRAGSRRPATVTGSRQSRMHRRGEHRHGLDDRRRRPRRADQPQPARVHARPPVDGRGLGKRRQ